MTIGVLGFDSRRGLGIILFTAASRPALASGLLFNWYQEWSYTFNPPIRLHGVVLSLSTGTTLHLT